MSTQHNEIYWAYSMGAITFEQMKEQLALLNEMEELKKECC